MPAFLFEHRHFSLLHSHTLYVFPPFCRCIYFLSITSHVFLETYIYIFLSPKSINLRQSSTRTHLRVELFFSSHCVIRARFDTHISLVWVPFSIDRLSVTFHWRMCYLRACRDFFCFRLSIGSCALYHYSCESDDAMRDSKDSPSILDNWIVFAMISSKPFHLR